MNNIYREYIGYKVWKIAIVKKITLNISKGVEIHLYVPYKALS